MFSHKDQQVIYVELLRCEQTIGDAGGWEMVRSILFVFLFFAQVSWYKETRSESILSVLLEESKTANSEG